MRKSLGSFLLLLILLSFAAHASTYKWSTFVSKDKVYVGETVYIKYLCEFDDNAQLYIIDFEPRSNDLYDLVLLSKDEQLKDGKRRNSYEYILKPKIAQTLKVQLEASMKLTSLDSIVDNTTNHYDDTKFDSIHETTVVKMEQISLEVLNPLKELVGKFELQLKKDKSKIKAYEPYHLDITFSGQGNFDAMKALEFDITNVKTFAQKPIKNVSLDKDGYKGTWTQKFAFVSGEDFIIPSKKIEYFDEDLQKIQILETEAIKVTVNKAYKKSELLDEVEEDPFVSFVRASIDYLYYLAIFLTGFLIGKINFKVKKLSTKDEAFITKLKATKSLDELSMLLILDNEKKFSDILSSIDSKELTSLAQAKKLLIRGVNEKKS